jgi:hypothetical protein
MKTDDMKTGMYVVTEDVKNPKPDRRAADRNFSAWVTWRKGQRVYVEEDAEFKGSFRIYPVNYYAHLGVAGRAGSEHRHPGFDALVAALSPVEYTDKEWVDIHVNAGNFVIAELLKQGKVTREDVLAAERATEDDEE